MAAVNFDGGLPAELVPTASQTVTNSNYINFQDSSFDQWTQQYMPDLYEAEVERYGNRMVSSLLRMTGAEMPLESDQVLWTEQGRLHLSYSAVTIAADSGGANVLTIGDTGGHALRVGNLVVIQDTSGNVAKAKVTVVTNSTTVTVAPYGSATGLEDAGLTAEADCNLFVFGSEFGKGTDGMAESITPEVNVFSNKPFIQKDKFSVNGSDATQVGWIEVSGEAGQSGYFWYLKGEGDTRTRFEDYCEMAKVEIEPAVASSAAIVDGATGSTGLFKALEDGGINAAGAFDAAADVISDFDEILKKLDEQGGIEENMLFLNRTASIELDNGLATQNSYGAGGTSYGVFSNSEDMALNLGFSGFRRGGYDFYKSDWKYLNDKATRGGITDDVQGVLIPAGVTSVYDQNLGKNIRRPFLHVRYRAAGSENRKMKSWVIGSVGGAANSSVDTMDVHFLSEACLVTQAANNFVLFKA